MPPNNKKKGRNNANNKKKKSTTAGTRNEKRGDSTAATLSENVPTFHKSDSPNACFGGFYVTYKQATQSFWDWMKEALPNEKMQFVHDLQRGADRILDHNTKLLRTPPSLPEKQVPIVAPPRVLTALTTSIDCREEFTKLRFGVTGGDEGHQHMVEVLRYCRSILQFSRQVARVVVQDLGVENLAGENEFDGIGGRFAALLSEEDESDEVVSAASIREGKTPDLEQQPKAPKNPVSIEDALLKSDARLQALCLLQTMDDMMGLVDQHYGFLKNVLRRQEASDNRPVQLLLECTAAANMAIESVKVSENSLYSCHPHITSFYHVLAVVFLPELIERVESKMGANAGKTELALQFVGVVVECAFHNRGREKLASKVKRFVKKLGVPLSVLQAEADIVYAVTELEVLLACHERKSQLQGMESHTWFKQSKFIGNDRCILNTQVLIQKVVGSWTKNSKLVGVKGFWGDEFQEDSKPASRIRGQLDETLAGHILPELIAICHRTDLYRLPERMQLIPVLDLLHEHLKGDEESRPVPVALTFGLHAMLTSILVLQGSGDLSDIASYSKQSFNKLFSQLDELAHPSKIGENSPSFLMNVGLFKNVGKFARPIYASKPAPATSLLNPAVSEQLGFWNPVIGGGFLLYATFVCNIGLGSATVDSLGQLRFALHLYNALRTRDESFDIPMLSDLDSVFAKTRAIWVGGRPQRGSLCKTFWMSWGMSVQEATRMASLKSNGSSFLSGMRQSSGFTRDLVAIYPEEFSSAYRRVVKQDFRDEDDAESFTVRNATKKQKREYHDVLDLMTRVNIMRDSMDDDENVVLPVNFSLVGSVLLDLKNKMSAHMGWDIMIKDMISEYPASLRAGKTMGGRKMGGFSASDLNLRHQALAYFLGDLLMRIDSGRKDECADQAAVFLTEFCKGLSVEKLSYFIETGDDLKVSKRINPLKGTYPRGRTGKTPNDPLHGFFHFKLSKKGKPVVRRIKPGKYTPFLPTGPGIVENPYQETGSKARPMPQSGKFRHIASYNLDELIELGWDGAKYLSRAGKHQATGFLVPFVPGYDSDSDDEYERVDVEHGKAEGTIGVPLDEVGLYTSAPDRKNPGKNAIY